ncbi:CHAT domain-containing tetratricopeptide repeat protein [Nocardiopsis tropica]|uniref:CHAT domain-containing protein n=1 Tax=Nocardiopsis tropica TaxID=109330 RepID=UPI002E85843F|nr:CHAT domain-containing tetratricopeptide repeat protein [Nocardiopsis tropica]
MQEQWWSESLARILEAINSGNTFALLNSELDQDLQELQLVAFFSDQNPSLLRVSHAVGWFQWLRYLAVPGGEDKTDLHGATDALVPCFFAGLEPLPRPLLPLLADASVQSALQLLDQAMSSASPELATTAVSVWERIVSATPDDHHDRFDRLSSLGIVLHILSRHTGRLTDLDRAINTMRQAVHTTPARHPDRAVYLSNLGAALADRYRISNDLADLNEAVDFSREAVQCIDDHPDQDRHLHNLGLELKDRYRRTGQPIDLDEAIASIRQGILTTPDDHPDRFQRLTDFAGLLTARFEHTGSRPDVDEAVSTLRKIVQTTPEEHPHRNRHLAILGAVLRARAKYASGPADLNEAIDLTRWAVNVTPDDHPDQVTLLLNLGMAISERFEHTGDQDDLDEAITTIRQAIRTAPQNHPSRTAMLSNLAIALRNRFDYIGGRSDLNEAVELNRQVILATPDESPNRGGDLSNLAVTLHARFHIARNKDDLDEAIATIRKAIHKTPENRPNKAAMLSNLGIMLRVRFKRIGDQTDVDEAIEVGRLAVDRTNVNAPEQAGSLFNLGIALAERFEHTGNQDDLDEAITATRQAIHTTPANDPHLPDYLCGLAARLSSRVRHTGDQGNLRAVIELYARVWRMQSATPTVRIHAGYKLADLVSSANPAHAAEVLQDIVGLLPKVAPHRLARTDQQYQLGQFSGLAGKAAGAVLNHPGLSSQDRAIQALGIVETGRGVLLSQALNTRNELTDLQRIAPDLANRYAQLRNNLNSPELPRSLETASATETSAANSDKQAVMSDQRMFQDRHLLASEFDAVLENIRTLDGFSTFGLNPSVQEIIREADQGPIIVFNTTPERCDALLLTNTSISHLELPDLTWESLVEKVNIFRRHRTQINFTKSDALDNSENPQQELIDILAWLWDVAAGPVLNALGLDTEPEDDSWPRVWWSPGGLLGLLPLHAAGHHTDPPGSRRTVMDRVISSYTPTVRALRYAREQASRHESGVGAAKRALVVAMPTTPGLDHQPGEGALPFVTVEREKVHRHLPEAVVLTTPDPTLSNPNSDMFAVPTREQVLEHLPRVAIAHLACHGQADPVDPSQSRLLLHDHADHPLTVAQLGPLQLDHARLAYLSACSTVAITKDELLDEAIHVASAFQLAGFPHVVGTLWEVNDKVSGAVADLFYAYLRNEGDQEVNPTRAARALHAAVRAVRDGADLQDILPGWDRIAAPLLWAPYLHTGA